MVRGSSEARRRILRRVVRGFTLLELLIVLLLYSLILLVVFPVIRNKTSREKDVLRNIINRYRFQAYKLKEDVILFGEDGVLRTSTGHVYKLPNLVKGFCIIRSSGTPLNCEFKLSKEIYVFSSLGFKKFPLREQ